MDHKLIYSYRINDLNNMCRICLENSQLYPIFNYRRNGGNPIINEDLSFKITECSNVKINQNDGLSEKICDNCLDLLMAAHKFKLLSEESDRKIKRIIHENLILNLNCNDGKGLSAISPVNESLQVEVKKEFTDEDALEVDKTIFQISIAQQNNKNNLNKLPNLEFNVNDLETEHIFYCYECNQNFPDKSFLRRHASEVHGDKKEIQFNCYNCEKSFQTNWNRSIHEKKCLKAAETLYKCSVCSMTFDNRKSFSHHVKKHHEIEHVQKKKINCDRCPKIFKHKSNLRAHQLLHLGIKKFVCEVCGSSFARQDYLTKHLRTHHQDHPYTCSVDGCNYASAQRNSLVSHMRTHTKEKPFRCSECNHSSATSGNLLSHIKMIHMEIELFKCRFCAQAFKRKYNLKEHITIEHCGLKPICTNCDRAFNSKKNLDRHLKCQHQKKVPQVP